ncbi:hypothetical protein COC63_05640 [Bacillus cereus]|nr:hypothetical protein COC63_05640 [Bacillus cereus]
MGDTKNLYKGVGSKVDMILREEAKNTAMQFYSMYRRGIQSPEQEFLKHMAREVEWEEIFCKNLSHHFVHMHRTYGLEKHYPYSLDEDATVIVLTRIATLFLAYIREEYVRETVIQYYGQVEEEVMSEVCSALPDLLGERIKRLVNVVDLEKALSLDGTLGSEDTSTCRNIILDIATSDISVLVPRLIEEFDRFYYRD